MKNVLILIALLALVPPAYAADYEQGVQAYGRQDYAAALAQWRPLAEQGDAKAQYGLGTLYAKGQGVSEDQAEASRWYRKAAEQGLADAQHNLGVRYQDGRGVSKDLGKAARWYRRAAEQGQYTAQNNLGLLYAQGLGVDKDLGEATRWIARAARAGNAAAVKNMPRLIAQLPQRRIGGSKVNVRAEPAAGAKVLLQSKKGAEARVLATRGDWDEVVFPANNLVGWVASFLLEAPAGGSAPAAGADEDETGRRLRVAGSRVNVRARPSTDAEIVMQADEGMRVQVLKTRDDWTRVVFDKSRTIGWIASRLLAAP